VDTLSNLRQHIPRGERLYAGLAVVAMVVIGLGYFLFAQFSILPQLRARDALISQLASAQQKLAESRKAQEKDPEKLKSQLATAQAILNQTGNFFLSDSQAADALNKLSSYAGNSGVTIANLQTLPSPQKEKSAYDIRLFRVQVEGNVPNLLRFVTLIQEAAFPGYVISNVNITEAQPRSILAMDIALYTSPYSAGSIVPATPAVSGAATASPPTPTPTSSAEQQLTQRLDQAWAAGDWTTVIGVLDEMSALQPGSTEITQKLYAALVNYGRQLANAGKLEEAKAALGRALVLKPDGAEALAALQALAGGAWSTPTIPTPTPQTSQTVYVVQPGDTLFSIARRYGVTVQAIRAANGLTSNNIRVGTQLLIPAR
jgi:LysM repeat protein